MLPVLALLLALSSIAASAPAQSKEMEILMPGVSPKKEDTYLCKAVKIEDNRYISAFVPRHESGHAHHIILAGCLKPGSTDEVWNCGEMQSSSGVDQSASKYKVAPQCAEGTRMMYAYAMEAPPLTLPTNVTFGVGEKFNSSYLVVQVHYKNAKDFVKNADLKDYSGVKIVYQEKPSTKLGGIHLSLTGGIIPGHSITYMDMSCPYRGRTPLHPFAFRTHAHSHGRVVSGYRVRGDKWTLIGVANPQLPQMFYPVNNSATVMPGDWVAARCVMENDDGKAVPIGATQKDEMCNFYMMYWIDAEDIGKDGQPMCYSDYNGANSQAWASETGTVAYESATIPGTRQMFREFYKEMHDAEENMDRLVDEIRHEFEPEEAPGFIGNPYETELDDLLSDGEPVDY